MDDREMKIKSKIRGKPWYRPWTEVRSSLQRWMFKVLEQKTELPAPPKLIPPIPDPKWLRIFNDLSLIPLSFQDKGPALKRITDLVKEAMDSHACTLALVDLDRKVLTQVAGSGPSSKFEDFMSKFDVQLGSPEDGCSMDLELIRKGEPVRRYNLDKDGQGIANTHVAQRYNLKAGLCYPVKSEGGNGKLHGYLNHFISHSGPFTKEAEDLLGIFAHQAVNLLERFELFPTRDSLLPFLNDLSQSLLSHPPDKFLREVLAKACELLQVPACIIWRIDEEQQQLYIVAATENVDQKYRDIILKSNSQKLHLHLSGNRVASILDVTHPHPAYNHSKEAKQRGWVSLHSVPLKVENRCVGMLDVYTTQKRSFSQWERELFLTFANHVALAIQKIETLQERELLQRRQRIVDELSVIAGNELPGSLNRIANLCAEAVQAEACCLRLWNRITDQLEIKGWYGSASKDPNTTEEYALPIGDGIAGQVAETGQPYFSGNITEATEYKRAHPGIPQTSVVCVPIKSDNEIIGTLSVGHSKAQAFGRHHQRFLENVMSSVAIAIERTHLIDSLSRLALLTTQASTFNSLLNSIAELTRNLMRTPICLLWMIAKDENTFRPLAFVGPVEQESAARSLHLKLNIPGVDAFLCKPNPVHFLDITQLIANPNATKQQELGWKSVLGIALNIEGQASGILEVYSRSKERQFSPFHQDLFKTFSGQVAIAIGHYRNRERAENLNIITHEAAEVTNTDQLLKLLLEKGLQIAGSSRGWVSRFDPQTGERTIIDSSGNLPNQQPLKHDEGITGEALRREAPINAEDVTNLPWSPYYRPRWKDTRSELAVPIIVQNAETRMGTTVERKSMPIGVLNIESPTIGAFSPSEENILWWLTRYVAVLFGRLEFDQKMTELSQIEKRLLDSPNGHDPIPGVLTHISKMFGFDYVAVLLIDQETNRIRAEYFTPEGQAKEFKRAIDTISGEENIYTASVKSREITVMLPSDPRFAAYLPQWRIKEKLIRVYVPMTSPLENRVIGILEAGCLQGHRQYFSERDIQLLARFTDHIARGLEQKDRSLLDQLRHEFTAPITGIRNNVSYLQRRLSTLSPDYLQLKFEDILVDAEILLHQVEQLEFILGTSTRKPDFQEVLVFRDIVIKTANQLRSLVQSKGLDSSKLYYRPTDAHRIRLYVDRGKLNQVVYNLLMYSIKYVDDDPSAFAIRITAEETKEHFLIKFRDWGIGIKRGYEEKIFERGFRTSEALQRDVVGSGLGLTIAREIMRELGGDLLLVNNYKPTEFQIILPKSLREAPE